MLLDKTELDECEKKKKNGRIGQDEFYKRRFDNVSLYFGHPIDQSQEIQFTTSIVRQNVHHIKTFCFTNETSRKAFIFLAQFLLCFFSLSSMDKVVLCAAHRVHIKKLKKKMKIFAVI